MKYNYVAYTADYKLVKDSITAADERDAVQVIESLGRRILKLDAARTIQIDWSQYFPSLFSVKRDEVIVFSRQLKLLIESGNDIVASLDLLQNQITNKSFKSALGEIVSDIRAGSRLADAMSKHPGIFPRIYCRSISVGEQTGELGMMLSEIANYLENEEHNKKGLKSALAYPLTVLVVAAVVVAILVNFVLPTFENLYATLGAELPIITRIFLTLANGLRNAALPTLGILVLIAIGVAFYFRTPNGKYQRDRLAFALPLLGFINRLQELAYCCRTMAVLFRSGLTSTEIMDVTIDSSSNRLMAEALLDVKQGMLQGEGLSKPMSVNRIFMPMMVEMVRVGEETGGLGDTLEVVAQTYVAEAQAKTRLMKAFIQTAVMIGITVVVCVVVLSMLSAMFGVYGQIS